MIRALTALLLLATPAFANQQTPYRVVVPFAPGGTTDVTARIFAEGLRSVTDQQVVVENRPGGNIAVAVDYVSRQRNDGRTLMVTTSGIVTYRHYNPDTNLYPLNVLSPVGMLVQSPMVMMVANNVEASNLSEFISLARSRPSHLTYAVVGRGSSLAMATDSFLRIANISMTAVPYTGGAPATLDLAAGRISVAFDSTVIGMQTHNAGVARAFAVTSANRSRIAPDIPTMRELGIDMDFSVWQGVFVSANTPDALRVQVNQHIRRVLSTEQVRSRYQQLGVEQVLDFTLDQAIILINNETTKWYPRGAQ